MESTIQAKRVKLWEGSQNDLAHVKETFFKNRNAPNDYESICRKDLVSYSQMRHMGEGVDILMKHVMNNHKILVLVDCDVDGYTSAAMLIGYLERQFPDLPIVWGLHTKKQHGLADFCDVHFSGETDDAMLVIIPDAGSEDVKECNILLDNGVDVLILDHHDLSGSEGNRACIISSQYEEYPNKMLSGAGVVYKFIKAVDDCRSQKMADMFLDLCAVGNIGDVMDMRSKETRYLVGAGLVQIVNPLLEEFVSSSGFFIKGAVPTIIDIQFNVVPLMNALIRVGSMDDKILMMEALLGHGKGWKDNNGNNLYHAVYLAANRAKASQNRTKTISIASIVDKIKLCGMNETNVIMVDVTGILSETLTGLVANALSDKYQRPCLLYRNVSSDETLCGGSGRNCREDAIPDFKQFCEDTGFFDHLGGHENAFGFRIKKSDVDSFLSIAEKRLEGKMGDRCWTVDFAADFSELTTDVFQAFHDLSVYYGKGLEEPLVFIQNIPANGEDGQFTGKFQNVFKMHVGDIDLIKFHSGSEDKLASSLCDFWADGRPDAIDAVCKVNLNYFRGIVTPQLVIQDYWPSDQEGMKA